MHTAFVPPRFGKLTLDKPTILAQAGQEMVQTFEQLADRYAPVVTFLDRQGIDVKVSMTEPQQPVTKEFRVILEGFYRHRTRKTTINNSFSNTFDTTRERFKPEYAFLDVLLRATAAKPEHGKMGLVDKLEWAAAQKLTNPNFTSLQEKTEQKIRAIKPDYRDRYTIPYDPQSPIHNYF